MSDYVNDLLDQSPSSMSARTLPEPNRREESTVDPSWSKAYDETTPPTENAVFLVLKNFLEAADASNDSEIATRTNVKKDNTKATTSTRTPKRNQLERALNVSRARQGGLKDLTGTGHNVSLVSMMHDRQEEPPKLVKQRPYHDLKPATAITKPRSKSENRNLATIITTGKSTPTAMTVPLARVASFTPSKSDDGREATLPTHPKGTSPSESIEKRSRQQALSKHMDFVNARLSVIDARRERMQEDDILHRVEDMLDSES